MGEIVFYWAEEAIDDFQVGPKYQIRGIRFPEFAYAVLWKYNPFHLMVRETIRKRGYFKVILELGGA